MIEKKSEGKVMKENAISKIKKMGEIGGYLTLIAKIFVIMGLVLCTVATIAFAAIPEEFMTVTVSGNAMVDIDMGAIGVPVDEVETETDVLTVEDSSFDLNGAEYYVKSMKMVENVLQIETAADDILLSLHGMVWVMLMAVVKLGMTLVTLFFVSALCKAFRYCESPFSENVTKKMQNLAISLIPWAFLTAVSDMAIQSCFTGNLEWHLGIDLNMVLIILLIFGLVYIFKYGAILQRESDETL